ncbi:MAG: hypothetical protein ACM3SY_02065 [Candidatus Omnitrophota bacterium]
MYILGVLSFFQMVFIPGFLLLKLAGEQFKISEDKNPLIDAVYCFALSLLINYLLVFGLTAAGIYKPITLYLLLIIEGIALVWYWIRHGHQTINLDFKRLSNTWNEFITSRTLGYNLLFILSCAVIVWYVFLFFYFMGDVFEHWDPVVGWNRFALDWAANRFPVNTYRYPQLIPSNWSMSYVLMQNTDIQCFAKSIMAFFPIGILLVFLSAGIKEKKSAYLLALIIYGPLIGYIYEPSYVVSGYVDIAVSFFAFLSFYAMRKGSDRMAIVFACAASVTKQAGLFFLGFILIWAFLRLIKRRQSLSFKKVLTAVALSLVAVLLITASWYVMKEIQIRSGQDISEFGLTQKANVSPHHLERLSSALERLSTLHHPKLRFFIYAIFALILLGIFHRESRGATLLISIPYFLLWGLLFSYDNRNLAPAIPFASYSAAFGFEFLKRQLPAPEKCRPFKLPVLMILVPMILLVIAANFTVFNNQSLIDHQIQKTKKIGDTELNDLLYAYQAKEGLTGKIATTYQYLGYLPGLKPFYLRKPGRITPRFLDFLDTPEGKEIHYLLMPVIEKSETEVYTRVREKITSGAYRLIFRWRGYHFIKIR